MPNHSCAPSLHGAPFTDEQLAVLKVVADNYLSGRRLMCFGFRAVVALGALAGAIAAVILLARDLHWLVWHG